MIDIWSLKSQNRISLVQNRVCLENRPRGSGFLSPVPSLILKAATSPTRGDRDRRCGQIPPTTPPPSSPHVVAGGGPGPVRRLAASPRWIRAPPTPPSLPASDPPCHGRLSFGLRHIRRQAIIVKCSASFAPPPCTLEHHHHRAHPGDHALCPLPSSELAAARASLYCPTARARRDEMPSARAGGGHRPQNVLAPPPSSSCEPPWGTDVVSSSTVDQQGASPAWT